MDLKGKKFLVTGAGSFLGKSLIPMLEKKGAKMTLFSSKEYDLRSEDDVKRLFSYINPEIVIHLAVDCGGFKYKKENPGSMFYNNTMMDALVQEYSRKNNVEKFVGIGTAASYPEFVKSPIKEEDLWENLPEKFNIFYGLSKKMMMVQSQGYRLQYGFNAIHLIPVNLYGPNYTLDSKSIRIIPILIKRMIEAKEQKEKDIELIGTPNAFREFLYVDDCAEAIIKATELYNKSNPINIGSGKSIKMSDLAYKVKGATGFNGKIIWKEKPSDNQPEKILDVSKAEKEFGFKAKTSLEEGLKKTVEWYLNTYGNH
jgi:GDP-L-fucose synthase